jgi:dTDP-4-dehydrorhamnose 3,5-epimerase
MNVIDLPLDGLKLVRPRVFADARGFLVESYRESRYAEAGIACRFVQDNHSRSNAGVLRGLHYQAAGRGGPGQAKLVRVARGRIFDVAVDIRPNSPTFGRWHGEWLDEVDHAQLFLPVGFAHGFCVDGDVADVVYKVSSAYDAALERSIRYDDPELGIDWPIDNPVLSERDLEAESFASFRDRVTG